MSQLFLWKYYGVVVRFLCFPRVVCHGVLAAIPLNWKGGTTDLFAKTVLLIKKNKCEGEKSLF